MRQDEDVLDTWFSSWLVPFSSLGWPDRTPDLATFYPGHTLVSAPEIIFFWVARMIMSGLYFMGEVPYTHMYLHGTVRDTQHRKMSKSLGNGIDPLEVVERYGADALRYSLVSGMSVGTDVILDPDDLEGSFAAGRNFANKLWNAGRFILSNLDGPPRPLAGSPSAVRRDELTLADRWIIARCDATVREATEAYEKFRLNDAAAAVYHFLWSDLADWYIEQVKPRLYGDVPGGDVARAVAAQTFDVALRLLHPVMPFVTEALWRRFPGRPPEASISVAPWPGPTRGPRMPPPSRSSAWCSRSWAPSAASAPNTASSRDRPCARSSARTAAAREGDRARARHDRPPREALRAHPGRERRARRRARGASRRHRGLRPARRGDRRRARVRASGRRSRAPRRARGLAGEEAGQPAVRLAGARRRGRARAREARRLDRAEAGADPEARAAGVWVTGPCRREGGAGGDRDRPAPLAARFVRVSSPPRRARAWSRRPGGPPDIAPPQLVATRPDSLASIPNFKGDVEFQFDEVISEGGSPNQGAGTGDLEKLVILSPTTRVPDVSWRRSRITVHPAEGWRPNRVYRVELLPGVVDLRRNQSKRGTVLTFTTGAPLPTTTIDGTVVDWTSSRPSSEALVEALLLPDSLSYRGLADSSGHFSLGPLPAGEYLVRGVIDQNRNNVVRRSRSLRHRASGQGQDSGRRALGLRPRHDAAANPGGRRRATACRPRSP